MRKELVYSLLAVAAGPAVPVTVNAAEVPTGAVQDKNWSGADKVTSGVVYISTGEPISCNLGTLEIGKYKLIIGSFSATTDITVNVEGQSETFAAAAGKGTVEFELTEKKAVTFTITPSAAATCEISGVEVSLDADFEGIAKTLLSMYNNAYNKVSNYGYTAEDNTEVLLITKQLTAINAIDKVTDGDTKAYTDVYIKYALWNGVESTDMYKNIVAAEQAADPKEIAFQANALETSLAATKKLLDDKTTPDFAKNGSLDDYKKDGSKGLTAKYNDLVAQAAAYKAGSEVEGWAAIADEITTLDKNIKKAQAAGGGNTTAYEKVKGVIETAQTTYQTKYKTITTETIPVTANKNLAIDDINETLRADAIAELQKQLDAIGMVNQANEEAYANGESEAFEKKGTYTTDLATADANVDKIKSAYATHVTNLKNAYTSYDTEFANVAKAKETNKVAIEKDGEGVAEAVTKMDNALAAVAAAIDANKGAAKIDALNLNAYGEKATDLIQAVEDAIAALDKACADITANEAANTAMKTALEKEDAQLAKYVEAINKAKYADYDPLAGGYAADYEYVQKLGKDLAAAIKKAYEESKAVAFQAGDYATGIAAYKTAIGDLNTAITADQANYKAVYDAINGKAGARAEYDALLAKVKGLTIYTSTDVKTVYSKAWMDAELKKITDIEDAIKKALALTDGCAAVAIDKDDKGAHQTAIQALKQVDVDAITAELNAENVDADIEADNVAYEKQLSADALANLQNAVNVQLKDQNTRIKAIKAEVAKNTYGLTTSEIDDKATKIETDYKKLDANLDGVYDNAKADVAELNEAQEAIEKIETALADLEKLAAAAADKVKANIAAFDALAKAVKDLQTEYDMQKAAADKDDKDAATDWADAFTGAQGAQAAIDALFKGGAIVDKDVKASYDKETLQESDYSAKVTAIQEKITAAKTIADNAQANFKANADLVKLAGEVDKAITDAKAAAKTADATAYTNFYQKEFEDEKSSYQKSKADIDAKIADAKTADGTIAAAKPEAAEKMSAAQKAALTTELNNLKDAVGKVEAAVKANKAAYDKQKLALDGDKDNIGAKKTYNEVSMKLATLDETTESKSWKEEMNGYNDQLIAKEEDVEAYYKKGQSQTQGEDKDGLTNAINDLKSKIEIIKGKIEGEYNASVQADNEAKLAEVREAIAAAKQAFKDANEYTAQFKNLTSEFFQTAISNADAAAPTLNNALTEFPTKIDAAEAQAQKDFDAVNASPKVWKYEADLQAVTDLTDGINDALDDYKNEVKKGIDVALSKVTWADDVTDGKTAIANFTIDDKALEKTKINAFFADADQLLADIDEAYKALDVAMLDELAKVAASELKTMIASAQTAAADAVIRPLITEADQKVIDGNAALSGDDLTTFETEVETLEETLKVNYNKLYEKNGITDNTTFTTQRDNFVNWLKNNKYETTLALDATYDQLQTLISEREADLAEATAEIEKYAAAGDLKKADLATIQSNIDKFKADVESKKGKAAINLLIDSKKDPKDPENNDNLTLQGIDGDIQTALTTSLKTFEGNYLVAALNDVTSAIYDLENNGGDAAQIADFKDKVQNAKTGLKVRLDADIVDAKKTAEDLLPYEKEISDLLAEINAANNVDNSAIIEDLNSLIAAVEAKIALSEYDEAIQQSLAEAAQAIQAKLDAVKAEIAGAENVAFSKDNFENTIAAIDKEADALIAEADNAKTKADNNTAVGETIMTALEELETKLNDAKARLDDTNQYEYVNSTTFKTKLAQIEKSIADVKAAAEAAIAEGKAADFKKDTKAYTTPITKATNDIADVLNSAAKRELKAVAEKLRAEIDAITYNESDYTDGDLVEIKAMIKAVDGKVGEDTYYDEDNKKTVDATGLFATAAAETDANLDADKKTAAGYAQDIEDIKEFLKTQSNIDHEAEAKAVETINAAIAQLEADLAAAQARLDDAEVYETVSSDDFESEISAVQASISALKTAAAAAAAEDKAADFVQDKAAYLDPVANATKAIQDILDNAAKAELTAAAGILRMKLDAITYNEADYSAEDLAEIQNKIATAEAKIGKAADGETAATGFFAVAAAATDANLEKEKENAEAYDALLEEIQSLIEGKAVVVVPGDITGTGEVTGDDFDQFAQDLVNGNVPAPGDPDFAAYDANGDGQITVADLQAILNLMVGNNADGTPKTAARSKQTAEEASGTLSVKATQMGNVTRLAVVLNSTSEFTGFQMDVLAPAGTRVVGESLGENMPEMMLLSSDLATSAHRIVGFASNGTLSNGTVLYIDVEGAGDVKFADVVFTTAKAKSVTMNLGDATGINGIEAEQNDGIFYDLGGKVMRTLKKGINIIRNANGTTKKVVVK